MTSLFIIHGPAQTCMHYVLFQVTLYAPMEAYSDHKNDALIKVYFLNMPPDLAISAEENENKNAMTISANYFIKAHAVANINVDWKSLSCYPRFICFGF